MGGKYEDAEVQRHLMTCPYEVVAAPNGDAHVRVRGRDYSPPEVSALVLGKMRQTAEDWLGDQVTEAVVTVPARGTSKHCPHCLEVLRHRRAPDRPTAPGWKWAICPNPGCGWQGDLISNSNNMVAYLPMALHDGWPLRGKVRQEFIVDAVGVETMPVSGGANIECYRVLGNPKLTMREKEADPRIPVPDSEWDLAKAELKDGEVVPEPVKEGPGFAVVWRRGSLEAVVRTLAQEGPAIRQILGRQKIADSIGKR